MPHGNAKSGVVRVLLGVVLALVVAVTAPAYADAFMWCSTSTLECPECYAEAECSWCEVTGSGCDQTLYCENPSYYWCECDSGSQYECNYN